MAKLTLLQLTQDILNELESDSVNSIDDTEESLQVAQIIKTTYFNIVSQRDWPWLRQLSSLTGLGDTNNPTKMRIPETTSKIFWVKYNKKDVTWLEPKEFLDLIQSRILVPASVGVDANGYHTDRYPSYWTSYDDDYIFFDAYQSADEATLQQSKSDVYATVVAGWTAVDEFIPRLPEKEFPVLLAAAKATAFSSLKQVANQAAEAYASRGIVRAQNEAWKNKQAEAKSNKIDFGRK